MTIIRTTRIDWRNYRAAPKFLSTSCRAEFVLALMILGIMEASMTRRPSIPLTRKSGVTTVVGSSALPIRQVPTG